MLTKRDDGDLVFALYNCTCRHNIILIDFTRNDIHFAPTNVLPWKLIENKGKNSIDKGHLRVTFILYNVYIYIRNEH